MFSYNSCPCYRAVRIWRWASCRQATWACAARPWRGAICGSPGCHERSGTKARLASCRGRRSPLAAACGAGPWQWAFESSSLVASLQDGADCGPSSEGGPSLAAWVASEHRSKGRTGGCRAPRGDSVREGAERMYGGVDGTGVVRASQTAKIGQGWSPQRHFLRSENERQVLFCSLKSCL